MLATEWQDSNNNNNGNDDNGDNDGESKQEDETDVDEENSTSEELPEISLPGHTAAAINYDGPEFPVRELQPLPHSSPAQPTSDEMASRLKRADTLQTEVIDWFASKLSVLVL